MVTLAQVRTDLTAAINTADLGFKSVEYYGETMVPPVAVVVPGEPYLEPGDAFGTYNVRISVLLVAGKGTNKSTSARLDQMIEQVITALDDWDLTEVAMPAQFNLNGSNFLGTVLSIEQQIKI